MTNHVFEIIAQFELLGDLNPGQLRWVNIAGLSLLHFVWQGFVVGLVAWAMLSLLRKNSAAIRYMVACFSMLVLVCMPVANLVYLAKAGNATEQPGTDKKPNPVENTQPPNSVPDANEPKSISSGPPINPPIEGQFELTIDSDDEVEARQTKMPVAMNKAWLKESIQPMLPWVLGFWALGVLAFSLRFWWGYYKVAMTRKQFVPVPDRSIQIMFEGLVKAMNVQSATRLMTSAAYCVPTVVGCFRPIVVLPVSSLTGLSAKEIESLLAHELAHVKRYDFLINLIQMVIETLLFFHPVVWWISSRIRQERENCCDDTAIDATGDRKTYAIALANLTSVNLNERPVSSRHVAAATGGNLKMRIERILGVSPKHRFVSQWFAIVALMLTVSAIGVTVALANSSAVNERTNESDSPTQDDSAQKTSQRGNDSYAVKLVKQRKLNDAAYEKAKETFKELQENSWIAITNGQVTKAFDSMQKANEAADKIDPDAVHRYVFRPGVDDVNPIFALSPWSERANWVQLGRSFHQKALLTVAANLWVRNGKQVNHETVTVASVASNNETTINSHTVVSGMFMYDLTITESMAQKLDVYRFSVPGQATLKGWDAKCEKGWCRGTIPGLDVDMQVLAFIIPDSVIKPKPNEVLANKSPLSTTTGQ